MTNDFIMMSCNDLEELGQVEASGRVCDVSDSTHTSSQSFLYFDEFLEWP